MMKAMMDSKDVTGVSGDLIDIKILDFSEDRTMAYSAVVASAAFSYKGTPNDDVYVFTNVFKKVDGENSRRTRDRDAERLLHTVVQPLRKGKGEERG